MSTQHSQDLVEFDAQVAHWISEYRRLKREIARINEAIDIARAHIESALGEASLGLVNGAPAVRFSIVESERLDIKKAREVLPAQVLELLLKKSQSRRFVVLEEGDI